MHLAFFKTLPERIFALLLLVIFLPVLLVVYTCLCATSVPPHVITDAAVIRGTIVHTYRFRTTGRGTAAFHSIGRFLRRWGIDEWPSFWNVLRGEMRVVDISIWELP